MLKQAEDSLKKSDNEAEEEEEEEEESDGDGKINGEDLIVSYILIILVQPWIWDKKLA
jgi:hypothetical protein